MVCSLRLVSDGDRNCFWPLDEIVSVVLQLEARSSDTTSDSRSLRNSSSRVDAHRLTGEIPSHLLLSRPLAVNFSSLLDCNEPDLKAGEIHSRSHHT